MNLKDQEKRIAQTSQRIWLHNQVLTTLKEQQASIFAATPATRHRSQLRIAETVALLGRDADRLERQTTRLITSIAAVTDIRISEILTRRYLNKQTFALIAREMGYDLRWVYRLHHAGLALTEDQPKRAPENHQPRARKAVTK